MTLATFATPHNSFCPSARSVDLPSGSLATERPVRTSNRRFHTAPAFHCHLSSIRSPEELDPFLLPREPSLAAEFHPASLSALRVYSPLAEGIQFSGWRDWGCPRVALHRAVAVEDDRQSATGIWEAVLFARVVTSGVSPLPMRGAPAQ